MVMFYFLKKKNYGFDVYGVEIKYDYLWFKIKVFVLVWLVKYFWKVLINIFICMLLLYLY